jgi:hypothetical protein
MLRRSIKIIGISLILITLVTACSKDVDLSLYLEPVDKYLLDVKNNNTAFERHVEKANTLYKTYNKHYKNNDRKHSLEKYYNNIDHMRGEFKKIIYLTNDLELIVSDMQQISENAGGTVVYGEYRWEIFSELIDSAKEINENIKYLSKELKTSLKNINYLTVYHVIFESTPESRSKLIKSYYKTAESSKNSLKSIESSKNKTTVTLKLNPNVFYDKKILDTFEQMRRNVKQVLSLSTSLATAWENEQTRAKGDHYWTAPGQELPPNRDDLAKKNKVMMDLIEDSKKEKHELSKLIKKRN